MKRLWLWISISAIFALVLTACSGGLGFFPTPEPSTITLAVPEQYQTYYSGKIEEFRKKEPQITVEIQRYDSSASTAPDVTVNRWIDAFDNNGEKDPLANGLDLTPFLEQGKNFNRADYYPGLLETYTRDGKLKGLPTGVDPFVILYNQDLFDTYGVAYPKAGWTWADFKTTAMQLRDPGAQVYGYATMQDYIDALFFVYQHGGSLVNGTSPQLDSPEAIEAIEWYANLYGDAGVAPTDAQASKDFNGPIGRGLMDGKIGMWMATVSTIVGQEGKGWPFRVGIASLPREATAFTVAQYEGLIISAQTKSPQASWKLVNFLSSQPLPWMVPARLSLANSPEFAASMGKAQAEGALSAMKDATLISNFDFRTLANVVGIFSQATKAVAEGSATAQEALTVAQREAAK